VVMQLTVREIEKERLFFFSHSLFFSFAVFPFLFCCCSFFFFSVFLVYFPFFSSLCFPLFFFFRPSFVLSPVFLLLSSLVPRYL